MSFAERYKVGTASELVVLKDLESRGWNVEPGSRHFMSPGLSKVLTNWRDSHSRPCFLRWSPDWIVWQTAPRMPSNLYAVDVKTGGFHIERRALLTYEDFAERLNIPVVVVFDIHTGELLASSAGKLAVNTIPKHGVDADRTPYFNVDFNKLSPMEKFFGPIRSTK
jgi:hypothetical protein